MSITPEIALFLIVIGLLTAAITQWSRYLRDIRERKRQQDELQASVDKLVEALTEDIDGNDVVVSLREAKHYTANDQQLVHTAIDEMRHAHGLAPIDWPDREQERQKFLALYHDRLSGQQGPE